MTTKKRGTRPPPFDPLVTPQLGDPVPAELQPTGYEFTVRVTGPDAHLVALLAHRHRVTPVAVMDRVIARAMEALRAGALD